MDMAFMEIVNRAIAINEFLVAGSSPGRVQLRVLAKAGVVV